MATTRGKGEGSLHFNEAKGLWVGTVELDPAPDGKRRRKFVSARKKQAALAKMHELEKARDAGQDLDELGATTTEWLEHWTGRVLPTTDLSPGTISDYRWITTRYLIPHLGRRRLVKLKPEHVERMMAAMRDAELSARTIAYTRTVLRMALAEAERRGRVPRNVAALTRAPRKSATKIDDALDAGQAAKVLATSAAGIPEYLPGTNVPSGEARPDRLYALAVLVLAVGLRQGEALRLRWPDVNFKTKTLKVTDAKTDAGVRTVALPPFVLEALKAHRARQKVERMAAPVWADNELVFPSNIGTKLEPRNVLRWWHALTIRAGVGRRRFHASRHTAATLMLNNGVELEVVSATLGHAGLAITADVYAKVRPNLQRKAADVMEQVLGQ